MESYGQLLVELIDGQLLLESDGQLGYGKRLPTINIEQQTTMDRELRPRDTVTEIRLKKFKYHIAVYFRHEKFRRQQLVNTSESICHNYSRHPPQ